MITLSTISEPGSTTWANEDTFFAWQDEHFAYAGVLDGVTQMLTSPALEAICQYHRHPLTPGRFAATKARDVICHVCDMHATTPLHTALKVANTQLRQRVIDTIGDCSLAAFQAADPRLAALGDDPRSVRVLLPATVVTLARIDLATGVLTCAHLGDTALLHFPADRPAAAITRQSRQVAPDPTYQTLRDLPLDASYFPVAYAHMTPKNLTHDMMGRFYHNYVDATGNPDTASGIGVLDGLPEMAAYIREYTLTLEHGDAVLLCSDGFLWPREPYAEASLAHLRASIAANGLAGYLAEVRAEETHIASRDPSPRLKVHDDATAVEMHYLPES